LSRLDPSAGGGVEWLDPLSEQVHRLVDCRSGAVDQVLRVAEGTLVGCELVLIENLDGTADGAHDVRSRSI
jgi:hypothetical protein